MPVFAARRIVDGLLGAITDVPNMPDNLVERAIPAYGGDPSDWEETLLTDTESAQLPLQQNGAFLYLNGGIITKEIRFPSDLAALQMSRLQRGFIINKPITDIRKRKVTIIGV